MDFSDERERTVGSLQPNFFFLVWVNFEFSPHVLKFILMKNYFFRFNYYIIINVKKSISWDYLMYNPKINM